jgi:hypothetical protein
MARLPRASKASDGGPVINAVEIYPGAGAKVEERSDEIPPWRGKKCDKFIYFVRVMVSSILFFYMNLVCV